MKSPVDDAMEVNGTVDHPRTHLGQLLGNAAKGKQFVFWKVPEPRGIDNGEGLATAVDIQIDRIVLAFSCALALRSAKFASAMG